MAAVAQITLYLCALLALALFSARVQAEELLLKDAVPLLVPLYLDGHDRGTAQMLIAPDPKESYVQAVPLIAVLKSHLAEDKLKTLETAISKGFLKLSDGKKGGIDLRFDETLLAIVISLPPEYRKEQTFSARGLYDLSGKPVTKPSPVSAYMNMFGSQDYVETGLPDNNGRQPLRLSSDGAINIHGVVLENTANYVEDAEHPLQRSNTRLVYDLPDSMVRLAAGDLSYPVEGFQSFQSMLGATVARDFDLQPYRVSEPTGQTSFLLNTPSRVDIYVNDRKVQTLQLASGNFDVRNFPVVNGSNDVRLVITDATGRVEVKNFNIVSDASLLESGLHKYAYNLGVVSSNTNGMMHYDTSQPALSAFHLYGVNDWLTVGANIQADTDQHMGGVDATIGSKLGILRADLSESRIKSGNSGFALQGQYQYIDPAKMNADGTFKGARNFTLLTIYQDRNFAPLGVLLPDNLFSCDTTGRYSQQLTPTLNLGIGGRYQVGRDGQSNRWASSLTFDKQLEGGFHVGVSMDHESTESLGVFLSFTWSPQSSRNFMSGSYDSTTHTTRADWNYAQAERTGSIAASAGVTQTGDRGEGNGSITYYGNRGDITANHDLVTSFGGNGVQGGNQERSEMRFGTALAMSDGHWSVSRPISGSFAMIAPDPAIEQYPIGVNPRNSDDNTPSYEAKTDYLGPAVLPELTPYMYRTVRVDANSLPPGFDPGETRYTLHPGYRSGTFIKIGSDANVLLDGTINYQDGSPVALQAGSIRPASGNGIDTVTFFTNRQGRFRIEKLRPGNYIAELYGFPGVALKLNIPKDASGPTQAGILTLAVMPDNGQVSSGAWHANAMTPETAAKVRDIFPEPPKQGVTP